jgi:copper(I)-binding protein
VTETDETTEVRTGPRPPRQRITRRGLQIALGVVWLVDGALQLQPFMFGPGFANQVLAPAADGQPGWVAAGVRWAAGLVGAHPAPWTIVFALAQLAIGIGLLVRPTVRVALAASIGWAALVWYFGEGLGGLASGHASLLTGAPGAVLLYALLAVAVWPHPVADAPAGWRGWLHHDSSAAPAAWTPVAWAVVWVGGALLQALPGQNTPVRLATALTSGDLPAWQMGLNQSLADHVQRSGSPDNWLLLAVLLAIGLCALGGPRLRTFAGWAGAVVATVFWMIGQGFGDLFSGQATDPNTGPVLILFALALLGTVPALVTVAEEDEDELAPAPMHRMAAMPSLVALVVVVVGLIQWGTTRAIPPGEQPHLTLTNVFTPAGTHTRGAPVYFTVTNTGNSADTLLSASTEFQTADAATGVSVCANPVCTGAGSVIVPAHSTVTFGPAGPHLVVAGMSSLAKGHQPLQLTLTFATSGVVHVLSPVGASNLSENDVMNYAYMGGNGPGMGPDGMPGMDMGGSPTTMPGMSGKPNG